MAITDLRLMYELFNKKQISITEGIAEPKLMVLHVDYLIDGATEQIRTEKRKNFMNALVERLQVETKIILKGSDENLAQWLAEDASGRLHINPPVGFEDIARSHIAGEDDPILDDPEQKQKNHYWTVLKNKELEGKESIYAYGPIFSYAENIEIAYNFFKAISKHKDIDLATFRDIIEDPQKAKDFAIDPLTRVALDTAIRFFEMMTKMVGQSA
jgi:hypothetical protein